MSRQVPVGEILRDMGTITSGQLEEALEYQKNKGGELREALMELGYADGEQVTQALAKHYNLEYTDLNTTDIPEQVTSLLSPGHATRFKVIPIQMKENSVVIAVANPLDVVFFDDLPYLLGKKVERVLASPEAMQAALSRYYKGK